MEACAHTVPGLLWLRHYCDSVTPEKRGLVLENTSIMLSIGILSYHVCTIMSQVAVNKFIATGMITNAVIVMGTGGPYIHIHRFGVGVPIAI